MDRKNIILLCLAAFIVIIPLVLYNGPGQNQGYFTGSDTQGSEYLESNGYQPWVKPFWKPPSGEIEVLLFSAQAAMGALILGYFIGYYKGKGQMNKKKKKD